MTPIVQSLTMTYLLWQLLGLLLVGLGVFIAKKNALLGDKRLIGYFLGAVIVLTAPALLGFLNYDFMPYGYLALAFLYLILGSYNTRLVAWVFNNEYKYRHELTLTLFMQVTAMLFFVHLMDPHILHQRPKTRWMNNTNEKINSSFKKKRSDYRQRMKSRSLLPNRKMSFTPNRLATSFRPIWSI